MADNPSYEQQIEMQYDALIKKALVNELKNYVRDIARLSAKQTLFSDLADGQAENFEDRRTSIAFELVDSEFQILQYSASVRDIHLCNALSKISDRARGVILMFYWLDMTDQEIAVETGLRRRTVNDIRNKAQDKMKKFMERDGYDASRFFSRHRP